jgi:hypothetical protein
MENEKYDGVFKARNGMHNERVIQIPAVGSTYYKRFVKEDGTIRLVPVI